MSVPALLCENLIGVKLSPNVFDLVPPGSIIVARPEMHDYLVANRGGRLVLISLDTYQAFQYDWTYDEVKDYLAHKLWILKGGADD